MSNAECRELQCWHELVARTRLWRCFTAGPVPTTPILIIAVHEAPAPIAALRSGPLAYANVIKMPGLRLDATERPIRLAGQTPFPRLDFQFAFVVIVEDGGEPQAVNLAAHILTESEITRSVNALD
jgi:hypothetical protein